MYNLGKTKLISLLLAIVMVVGCVPAFAIGAVAEEAATQPVYYIQGGATGTGASADSPAGTMSALVAKIQEDGNNVAGKEVIVKLMNGSGKFAYNTENGAYAVVPYNATLIFERYDENVTSNLWVTSHADPAKRNDYSYIRLGGDTVMRNISLAWQIYKTDWRQHYANGHDWILENVTFRAHDNSLFENNNKDVMSAGFRGSDSNFHTGGGAGGTLSIDQATLGRHNWGYLDFAGNRSSETYDNDVKIVVGAANFPQATRLNGGNGTITYNKNVNFVLDGTTINGISGSATIKGAFQVIYNNGATISGTDGATSYTRYDIKVADGGYLDTTETAGTYTVVTFPEGKNVAVAKDASGNEYRSSGNTLTVPAAGTYNVTFEAEEQPELPEDGIYYLKGGATGGTGAASAPFGTIAEVVAAAEAAGLNVAGEEITIKVVATNAGYGEDAALYINPYGYDASENGYSALKSGAMSSVLKHEATLVFESASSERALIWAANATSSSYYNGLRLGGPVVLRGITLGVNCGSSDAFRIYATGHDLTMEDVKFVGNDGQPATSVRIYKGTFHNNNGGKGGAGGTLTVDTATLNENVVTVSTMGYAKNIWSGYDAIKSIVEAGYQDFEGEVKLVLGAGSFTNLAFRDFDSADATVNFKDDVNIILNGTKVTKLWTNSNPITMAEGKAVQIIYNDGASISEKNAISTFPTYHVYVEEGGSLDTTATAGTYKVTFPEGKTIAKATGDNGTFYSTGDTLTVPAAGTYNVTFLAAMPSRTYYLAGGATDGNGTEAAPFGTLEEVVKAAEANGLNVAGEEITVKVIAADSDDDTSFGGADALYINPLGWTNGSSSQWSIAVDANTKVSKTIGHEATLIIESADEDNRSTIWAAQGTDRYCALRLGGPTIIRNIDLKINRASGVFPVFATGYDLTLEDVKFFYSGDSAATSVEVYQGAFHNNQSGAGIGEGGTVVIDDATMAGITYVSPMGWTPQNQDWVIGTGAQSYDNGAKMILGEGTVKMVFRDFGGSAAAGFGDNVNIILNGTTLSALQSNSNPVTMADGKYIQIIRNNGASVNSDSGIYGLAKYDIIVEEGGSLDTTAAAGTYKVTFPVGRKAAVATDAEGNTYTSVGDTLTVGAAGTYNVTFVKSPYYFQGGATGDGTSAETPAGTMSALIAQIEADGRNIAGEEVVVKVMTGGTGYVYYCAENGERKIIPYNATLVFESYDAEERSLLAVSNDSDRADQHLRISGPTKFKNIGILFNRSANDWMETYAGGFDLSFESVTFYGLTNGAPAKVTSSNGEYNLFISKGAIGTAEDGEGGTLIIDTATFENNLIGYISAAAGANSADITTMDEDVKIVLGKGKINTQFRLGGAPEGTSIAYKKNVNIVLNGTEVPFLFNRNNIAPMTEGHALQIIYNDGATIAGETTGTYAINVTRYDIFVEEGGALDTTDVAGKYAVAYPEGKGIVYAYAVNAEGNYDGTTPVYYTTAETITVGAAGKYNVGFVSDISEINVEIVNDFEQFDGWINNEAAGTLTPAVAASNAVETTVSGDVVYTADVTIATGKKAIISVTGNVGETEVLNIFDGGMKIGGYVVPGTFTTGTYGIKLTIAPSATALFVEVTKPDGTVIRRGADTLLGGNTVINTVTAKSSEEGAVANIVAVASDFVADAYTINEEEPTLSAFEENVYNIVTSYDGNAKTTRNFAFTVKAGYLADGEAIVVRYAPEGSDEFVVVDAVQKAEKTVYEAIDFYEVDITGLTAGTTYNYQIGKNDGSDWSDAYSFTTEPENAPGFSFITISDTQGTVWNGERGFMYAQAAINKALEEVANPAFILNAGDVVEGTSSDVGKTTALDVQWSYYFKALGDTAKSIPHFAAMGNHDYHGHGGPDNDFLFNLHFNHPNNGGRNAIPLWANMGNSVMNVMNNPKESAYYFDYDNTRFAVINTGPSGGTDNHLIKSQKTWLQNVMSTDDVEWKVLIVHQPAYYNYATNDYFSFSDANILIEELGIDLVIQGHAHYNTRTYPMKNGEPARTTGNLDVITKGEGTVYSIVGSTATNHDELRDGLNKDFVSVFSPANEMPVYATVDVTDDTLTYTVKQLDGFIVDKFTIEKDTSHRTLDAVGVQIRIPTEENPEITQGLRFINSIPREAYDELVARGINPTTYEDTTVGFGSIIIPENYLNGAELTKDTEGARVVPAVKLYSLDDNDVKFTVCLTDIATKNYTRNYCVVPYITVMDGAEEITYYGEMQTASVYDIAVLACADDSNETEATKQYLKTNVLDVVDAAE